MGKAVDLSGMRFGRLLVLKYTHSNHYQKRCYDCQCDCGNIVNIVGVSMQTGDTRSCGCFQREEFGKKSTTHGGSKHPLYNTWLKMRDRCEKPSSNDYRYYGGRNIKVCPEWKNDFQQFLKDMGERPEGLTIDRIDNDGDYCKENCRWTTMEEQNYNTSQVKYVTVNGETLVIGQWIKKLGISRSAIAWRKSRGKTIEQVLEEHIKEKGL